ncbi:MAG: gliding motility-associated ABC transporter substrate-binding protein GldG [Bacteroidales bacterium]|jgi:ABC-2 type transport system permease protein|nr:gliding motility-associated ABC transporter substrate-binding protein GldG [Bacteroidales bacterium]MDY0086736.1 gliding motility-associated ABC transporter substrate-binding protein GldG [Bacteroidales bacterium]
MVENKTKKHSGSSRANTLRTALSEFGIVIVLIILLNIIGSFVFTRIDLTSEKRYTLSKATRDILTQLDDYVYFRVYLEGDFPAGFKKLRRETREMLDEFRAYSKFVEYKFVNPSESTDEQERQATYQLLVEAGLNPTDLQVRTNEGMKNQLVFPGALVNYRDKELAVDFLETQLNMSPEAALNASAQNLEYKLADIINKVTRLQQPAIAFIEGHGELDEDHLYDFTQTLLQNYRVDFITLDGRLNALTRRTEPDKSGRSDILLNYDAIVIAQPQQPFDEKDKFILDQYIMHGGKVLWMIDPVIATMDSLKTAESTVGVDLNVNLDDQLFKYGVRLNKNLLLDLNAAALGIRTGETGGRPQIDFFRWYYFPLLEAASEHPMVRNMNAVKAEFVSSIDTVIREGIRKTPLLKTSGYTRIAGTPALISLTMLQSDPDPRVFNRSGQTAAWLLEGEFPSLYANRMPAEISTSGEIGFKEESKPTAMIVIADGDMARNQFHLQQGYPLPLGYDQYTRQTYGNKNFLLNAVSYLVEGEGLISIRSRELKLRLLDANKVSAQRLQWQLFNTVLPVLLILLSGLLFAWLRKKRFTR